MPSSNRGRIFRWLRDQLAAHRFRPFVSGQWPGCRERSELRSPARQQIRECKTLSISFAWCTPSENPKAATSRSTPKGRRPELLIRFCPVEKCWGRACLREDRHGSQAIREIGVAGEIVARLRSVSRFYASHISHARDATAFHQIVEPIIPRVIDIRINLMRRYIPGLERKPPTDVPTCLTDPDRLAPNP